MKKIIILSLIASSFILAENIVNTLKVEQVNKVRNNSSFSNGAMVSQGATNIENNSNVEDVHILQRTGTSTGNLIENTTMSGMDSELHQGLTSVNDSTLHHAELTSKNSVNDVTVTGGKSTITQATLIISIDSNVSGTAGSDSGGMGMGASGENLEITQINLLNDTDIQNSDVHQGLTTITNGAEVSQTFKFDQTNTINRASASGTNTVGTSQLTQGVTNISGGTTTNIEQTIESIMEDIFVDGSSIKQSTIKLKDSTVSNINNGSGSSLDDKNRVSYVTVTNGSAVIQSAIDINASTVNGLYKDDRGGLQENNWMHTVTLNDSDVKQSNFIAANGSDVLNVTYTTHESGINATNLIYNTTASNDSELLQDVTNLDNGDVANTTFNRADTMNSVTADSSILKQFNVQVTDSTLNNSTLTQQALIYNTSVANARMSQGSTVITN